MSECGFHTVEHILCVYVSIYLYTHGASEQWMEKKNIFLHCDQMLHYSNNKHTHSFIHIHIHKTQINIKFNEFGVRLTILKQCAL